MPDPGRLIGVGVRAALPQDILLNVSGPNLLSRMLANPLLDGWAVDERSQVYQAIAPPAFEIAEGYVQLRARHLARSLIGPDAFIATPVPRRAGSTRRWRAAPLGCRRASPSSFQVQQRGERASRHLLATTTSPPVQFRTVRAAQPHHRPQRARRIFRRRLADSLELGIVGNVPAGAVARFLTARRGRGDRHQPSGVPLIAGSERESDDDYRTRLLRYRRDPANGANAAHSGIWAEAVPARGPCRGRPAAARTDRTRRAATAAAGQRVGLYTGTDLIVPYPGTGLMAAPAVVDAVQQHHRPRRPSGQPQPADVPTVELPDARGARRPPAAGPTEAMGIAGIWSLRVALSLDRRQPTRGSGSHAVGFQRDRRHHPGRRPNGQAARPRTRTFTAASWRRRRRPTRTRLRCSTSSGTARPSRWRRRSTSASNAPRRRLGGQRTITFHGGWLLAPFRTDPRRPRAGHGASRRVLRRANPCRCRLLAGGAAQTGLDAGGGPQAGSRTR